MATSPTQIRIDSDLKQEATALFKDLGIDLSGAVNMFLRQCVMRGGIPFAVEKPRYSAKLLAAAEEARLMVNDPSAPRYSSLDDLKKALED